MTIHIRKGRHFANFWDLVKLTWITGVFRRRRFRIRFADDAFVYDEPDDYIGAYNKLMGRNHGLVPYARWGSTRLGWRTVREPDKRAAIELVQFTEDRRGFVVSDSRLVFEGETFEYEVAGWGMPCWTFFGGRYPAPEPFEIEVLLLR